MSNQYCFKNFKKYIFSGIIIPGEVYSENVISKNMGISKTPVHEALLELSHKGFVEIIPKRGFILKDLSEKDIRDIYNFRLALEKFVISEAVKNAKKSDIDYLESILVKISDCKDVMIFMNDAIQFHRYLSELDGNLKNNRCT